MASKKRKNDGANAASSSKAKRAKVELPVKGKGNKRKQAKIAPIEENEMQTPLQGGHDPFGGKVSDLKASPTPASASPGKKGLFSNVKSSVQKLLRKGVLRRGFRFSNI
jgi:hypothetical protein